MLVTDVFKQQTFKYIQTNCEDPAGTQMLWISNVVFLCLGLIVYALLFLK